MPEPRQVSFRSQQDFRSQLIGSLLAMGKDSEIYPKRRILQISQEADLVPIESYKQVRLSKNGRCVCYKGLRFTDRPKKRITLAQIGANQGRKSLTHYTFFGYKQYDIHLYKERSCFSIFHRGR